MRTLFSAAIVAAAMWCCAAGAQSQPSVGAVTQLQGSATVTHVGTHAGGKSASLKAGDAIFAADILETSPGAKLLVGFVDGTKLTLGPNADVVIDEFVFNPNGGKSNAALRVTAGTARFVAGAMEKIAGPQAIKVSTPVATIGVRGTDFFIEMKDDHLAVALFSGYRVAVTNAAGETTLRPGEGTDIWGPNAPTQALTWSTDRVNRALGLVTLTQATQRPLPYAQPVAPADDLGTALTQGKFKLDARYRYEYVDHDSQPRTAYASTLRLRLAYETQSWNGFFAGAGGEFNEVIGGSRRSDGVVNAPTLPLIADPTSEMLNLAYVGWTLPDADGLAGTRAVIGRQRLMYENERWIGPSNFRQNDQTFDAASIETRIVPGLNLRYAYVDRVNRVLGDNPGGHWHSDSHLLGATTDLVPFGLTTAYAYLIDLRPVPLLSSATYGVRYDGMIPAGDMFTFGLEAEVARQTDYAANPQRYALTYALLQPSVKWNLDDGLSTTLAAGWERLGGNGTAAVQTPLATLHRHNGWADVFTTTPAKGLDDFHVRLMQELPDAGFLKTPKLDLRYHLFEPVKGSGRYGTEADVDLNATILGRATVGFRAARYVAKTFDADTTKLWFYAELQY